MIDVPVTLAPSLRTSTFAGSFQATVDVEKDGVKVGGTSIMGLMMLAASPGCAIRVIASGPEAAEAIAALGDLIASRFGEEI